MGLIVSVDTPWLSASPDGRVTGSTAHPPLGLVEFKNTYDCCRLVSQRNHFVWKNKRGKESLLFLSNDDMISFAHSKRGPY